MRYVSRGPGPRFTSMAYYGIPSAGLTVSAGSTNDTFDVNGLGGTLLTANNLYGGDGNDMISLGAVGRTAWASARVSGAGLNNSGAADGLSSVVTAIVYGSATYTKIATGNLTGSNVITASITGVVTSDQAIRVVNGSLLQTNAGNDTIALGTSLTRASASTFAAGDGNDWVGWATNVDGNFSTSTNAGATVAKSDLQGGKGNDTIVLDGGSTFTAFSANLNAGNDKITVDSANFQGGSYIGLGAGNDIFSGDVVNAFTTSTLAGGKGNDTIEFISIGAGSAVASVVAGDRNENSNATDDGADLITVAGNGFISSTIYGGGGNDSLSFQASGGSGNFISMNAGNDVFTATNDSLLQSSTLGMGAGDDKVYFDRIAEVLSSTIKLGKGNDSIYLSANLGSGDQFSASTLYGGAGADYLLGSAAIENNDTALIVLEYNTATDSVISAYDTVAASVTASVSGFYKFNWVPANASVATFSASDVTASAGRVVFTSTYSTDVTSRVSALDTNITSNGGAAVFVDGSNNAYLFVKGSDANLVVKVGSATISGGINDASLTISNSQDMTLNLG